MNHKSLHHLKSALEVVVCIIVAFPICVATIICGFAIFGAFGIAMIIMSIVGIPICVVVSVSQMILKSISNKKESTHEKDMEQM